ncbi:hypothetical protein CYFUS_001269 [Cystobacter fuscus]|uniref:Uncharacterized protein n=1 Tax=Cystobacter fuscus TaxID=43 RepID=A0A250IVT4_9BACT|nr:ATP-binding protein [Cystobacter fuscus]ATB35855.1 hypothetical protein CYFUS_001269 [Cystobacter fuscus]
MIPDWSRLAPNRPLNPGNEAYVPRPVGAPRIADWILAGRSPLLVVGPVGVGKSTELAFAVQALATSRFVCRIPLDRVENMRTLTAERALLQIADVIARGAQHIYKIEISPKLLNELELATRNAPLGGEVSQQRNAEDLAVLIIREVNQKSTLGHVALLIDGLEKTPPAPAQLVFDALQRLLFKTEVELVVVVPWHAAYGPGAETVIGPGEKLIVVPPVEIEGTAGSEGVAFLRTVAIRRLQLDQEAIAQAPTDFGQPGGVLDQCAQWSGGIPRSFLQLLADAASYARVTDSADWPTLSHVAQAVADQRESFRRLLTPGDDAALRQVDGTDGRDMALDQKLRMLAHGVLLERHENGQPVMRPHPIVRFLI